MAIMKQAFIILFLFLIFGMSVSAKTSVFSNVGESSLKTPDIQSKKEPRIVSIILKNGTEYTGEVRLKRPHGIGKAKYRNGDVYEGRFVKGKRSVYGKIIYANGDIYEGGFEICFALCAGVGGADRAYHARECEVAGE